MSTLQPSPASTSGDAAHIKPPTFNFCFARFFRPTERLTFFVLGLLLAASSAVAAPWAGSGPVAFEMTLPDRSSAEFEPLLSVGTPGAGDIVFFRRLEDGRVCFGWEQIGAGTVFSAPINLPNQGRHSVLISLGSLWPADDLTPETAVLRELALIQIDGRTVLARQGKFSPVPSPVVTLGKNPVGGALAGVTFSGKILAATSATQAAALAAAAISMDPLPATAREPRDPSEYPGPIRLWLMFPPHLTGRNEPLVVTGVTGAGDFVYVRYTDAQHIQIGFDHWLAGGPLSEPIACDYRRPHELTISMGSLLAPADPGKPDSPAVARLRTTCFVRFDGQTVLVHPGAFHPTKPEQIAYGANRIFGSTADPSFSGEILRVERVAPEQFLEALGRTK